jgi:uncharacterized protein involved in exopolysaccharide biosynthesis
VTLVLEQNLAARSQRASRTLEFFDKEVKRLQAELVEAQEALAEFKQENSEALPSGEDFRRSELASLRQRRFDLERSLLEQRARLRDLRQRLEAGAYGPEFAQQGSPQQLTLAQLERDLSQASAVYAPSHPTIRRLRNQIAQLENSIGTDAADAEERVDPDILRRQARENLVESIELLREQVRVGEQELADLADRRAEIEDAMARAPTVALELSGLENRLSALRLQYEEAVRKRSAAETGQKLEVNQQAERFEVIEQARVPDEPESPDRFKIAAFGSAAGVGFAVGLALLVEMLNRTIYTAADIERMVQLRPLATVPYIRTAADRRARLRRLLFFGVLLVALPLGALYALQEFYMPLDLLWERFLQRSGADRIIEMLTNRF